MNDAYIRIIDMQRIRYHVPVAIAWMVAQSTLTYVHVKKNHQILQYPFMSVKC